MNQNRKVLLKQLAKVYFAKGNAKRGCVMGDCVTAIDEFCNALRRNTRGEEIIYFVVQGFRMLEEREWKSVRLMHAVVSVIEKRQRKKFKNGEWDLFKHGFYKI